MTKSKLPIFFHIRKCSGTTVNINLAKNFKEDEILYLYKGRGFFNLQTNAYEEFVDDDQINSYLKNLPTEKRNKIKVIFGHDVYYGIHRFFDREPFYFTFIREPFNRIVSLYKEYKKNFYYDGKKVLDPFGKTIFIPNKKDVFEKIIAGNRLINFKEWIESDRYDKELQTLYLINSGFLLSHKPQYQIQGRKSKIKMLESIYKNELTAEEIFSGLDKFSFIGTTENFQEDFSRLCSILNLKQFFLKENVSPSDPFIDSLPDATTIKLKKIFYKNNIFDEHLYHLALKRRPAPKKIHKKVAIFHDYFRVIGGAEKLVLILAKKLNADVITAEVDMNIISQAGFLDVTIRPLGKMTKFSFLLPPFCRKRFEECDFSKQYDFFIFSGNFSIYAAKKHHPHLWYCHTPLRGIYNFI